LAEASGRRHEYATLEHLLLALIEDTHASKVMSACGVDVKELRDAVRSYLDTELEALKTEGENPIPRRPAASSASSSARSSTSSRRAATK
jgi:ATP-dependent Clp protease ATP-binding subunit ClpA